MDNCVFCRIIKGDLPSSRIYENKSVLAFAPLKETIIGKGHMLIIPKKHYENIYDIPQRDLNNILKSVKIIAKILIKEYGAEGINLLHASGKIAQQSCFHFHLHLIPRYKDDNLDTWPKTGYKENNFEEVYKQLRELFI